MVFTDDNLKRFRKAFNNDSVLPDFSYWAKSDLMLLKSLLARLEAAEKVCQMVHKYTDLEITLVPLKESYEAWRKAAGK